MATDGVGGAIKRRPGGLRMPCAKLEQIEESVARYLHQMGSADR
jgi:hypothetical protein